MDGCFQKALFGAYEVFTPLACECLINNGLEALGGDFVIGKAMTHAQLLQKDC